MKVSLAGRELIKEFEGFRNAAYQDVVGVWTIGYGFTEGVKPGQRMTLGQASARLATELARYESAVLAACKVPPNQNQFDALCSLAWNIGTGAIARSSVIKAHNRGDFQSAARAFGLWNKAGGKEWPGLTRRRAAEAALYLKPTHDELPAGAEAEPLAPVQPMPQAVEPETSLAASGINRAATVAGTTAATVGAVSSIKQSLDDLGPWLVPALALAVAGLAAYIVWQRFEQRRKGWA